MRTIKVGSIQAPKDFPPIGTRFRCLHCNSTFEIEASDHKLLAQQIRCTVSHEIPGYDLACPNCQQDLFVPALNLPLPTQSNPSFCANCGVQINNNAETAYAGISPSPFVRVCDVCEPHLIANNHGVRYFE